MDRVAQLLSTDFTREKYRGQYAEARVGTEKVMLLKPMTYMNKSGESVALAARSNIGDPADVFVIYDEAELPLGKLRMRSKGSAGTHNGMKSVVERLGTREFPRLRVGVGRGKAQEDLAKRVLSSFQPNERSIVDKTVELAAEATIAYIEQGIESAMNEFNRTDTTETTRDN